jgi:hypothetical protein
MEIIDFIIGFILLTLGKKLYWLFVAAVGFVVGLAVADTYIQLEPHWLVYVVALGVGVIGALLATFLQKIALALVGFFVGGYGAYYLVSTYRTVPNATTNLAVFIVGGIVGLILVASLFNWALYILSSWAGSTLITQAVNANVELSPEFSMAIFFTLFVLGMVIQAGLLREKPKPKTIAPSQNAQLPKTEEK